MLGDVPIIDAVVHGFDFDQSNMINKPPGRIHARAHLAKSSSNPKYGEFVLDSERFEKKHTADALEGVASLPGTAPLRSAEILGKFLHRGGSEPNTENRVLWATGALAVHSLPLQQLFWDFEMPEDLIEGYGYHEVTEQQKRNILAGNFACKHCLDLDGLMNAIPDDEYKRRQQSGDLAAPWSGMPQLDPTSSRVDQDA